MTMAIVFGDRATARAAAKAVNQAHGRVRGDGYQALDPALLLWVHATLVDSALVTYEAFVRRLPHRDQEQFYLESKAVGQLLGIPGDGFPASLGAFREYMNEMMSTGPVRVGPRALELARQVLRPRLRLLPGPIMVPFGIVTAGLLPETLREQYGLPWGPRRQRAYRLAVASVPRIVALTPPVLRVWPLPGHSLSLSVNP